MKRLGILVCIAVASLNIFGFFCNFKVLSSAYAQTTPTQDSSAKENVKDPENTKQITTDQALLKAGITPMSRDELLIAGNKIFSDLILEEQALQTRNPKGSPYTVGRGAELAKFSDTDFNIYVEKNKILIREMGVAQKIFEANLMTPPSPSTNVYGDYKAAFQFAVDYMYRGSVQGNFARGPAKIDFDRVTREFRAEKDIRSDTLNNTFGEGAAINSAAYAHFIPPPQQECSVGILKEMNLGACISEGVTWLIKNTLLQIAGFLVWLTANMFNYAIQIGILQFSDWAPATLYPIWILIRQIVSLVVVFAVLYLGGLFMLGDENGKFEKIIPWLVMFALFVNFSYPLARTAIDISNIISLKVYASAVGNETLTKDSNVSFSSNNAGSLIMDKLGLQGLVTSATSDGSAATGLLGATVNSIPGALLAVVYVLYTAYIFFMVTLLMVTRTVALVFIIVASPLLLIDSVVPLLGEQAKKLRQIFIDQLLVGPIFMIMFALTIRFLDIFSIRGKGTISGLATGVSDGNSIVTFFNLLMMLIMLHVMLTVTKQTSGKIGAWGSEVLGSVGGFAMGTAFAGTGLLARQTVGRGALALQNNSWVKNNKDTMLGRAVHRSTGAVANSSLNMMKSGIVAGGMKKLGMGTGMGMGLGMGAQGGYIASQKRRESYDKEAREDMQLRHKESFTDEEGVFHRKGAVDEKATQEAKRRFDENRGKSIFTTKEQSHAISDRITKEEDEKIMKTYNELNTPKERKDKLEEYTRELERMKLKDPNLKDPRTQVMANFVATITKKEKTEGEAFAQELDDVIFAYKAKSGNPADQAKYLTSKSKKIQEAFAKRQKDDSIAASTSTTPAVGAVSSSVPTSSTAPSTADFELETPQQASIRINEVAPAQTSPHQNTNTQTAPIYTTKVTPTRPTLTPTSSTATNTSPTTAATSPAFDVMGNDFAQVARAKRMASQHKVMGQVNKDSEGGIAPQTVSTSPKVPSNPPLTATI